MIDTLLRFVVDEGKWLPVAMLLALASIAIGRRRASDGRGAVLGLMSLFFAVMIGTMAFGHLLAVTTKIALGTLVGSPAVLYPIGVALSIPAWSLALLASRAIRRADAVTTHRLGYVNGWLTLTLLALGLHNIPLALPGMLNLAYQFHTRQLVGQTIVTIMVVANLALFVGALVFMASGQTFEQFRGLE
jgi:hypothetical protein